MTLTATIWPIEDEADQIQPQRPPLTTKVVETVPNSVAKLMIMHSVDLPQLVRKIEILQLNAKSNTARNS